MAEKNGMRDIAVLGIDFAKHRIHPLPIKGPTRPCPRRCLAAILAGAIVWLQPVNADDLLLQTGEGLISTRIEGTWGRPVVFISGLGEEMEGWDRVASSIARCALVVRYDRPGIGSSRPAPDAPVLANDVALQLRGILADLDVSAPVILVAHSLGGLYAQAFARLFPEHTAGLVLVDASSPLEPEGAFVSTQPQTPGTPSAWESAGIAESVAALKRGPDLPDVPLLVLVATDHQDTAEREALWLEIQHRTAALSPQGDLRMAQGSGHFIQEDRPEAVVAAIEAVLAATGTDLGSCVRAGSPSSARSMSD
ncbi:alpha/beta fold hydrolase [Thiocapsa roseopersicina]|uniref:Pimeloyl-ACP methyl ester carboxylesterase n=1 Tax=Thiocapsa roseopersicina TaxID=1058 RepID=A0A1H2VGH4_THIRO|nr:alpha/beta hydrolase [Thiocapsa roseopersicina]SDW67476.1 Pimeloyl-ACP methyl ester carboxylesterase [Thiocapsa roseopersicina]